MELIIYEDIFYLKTNRNFNPATMISRVRKESGMRKNSFADKYVIKIISGLLIGAVDLGRKYNQYYQEEYNSFSAYLYKKEMLGRDFIEELNIGDSETLWRLRTQISNYSVNNIIGYKNENLTIINQAMELLENEN